MQPGLVTAGLQLAQRRVWRALPAESTSEPVMRWLVAALLALALWGAVVFLVFAYARWLAPQL